MCNGERLIYLLVNRHSETELQSKYSLPSISQLPSRTCSPIPTPCSVPRPHEATGGCSVGWSGACVLSPDLRPSLFPLEVIKGRRKVLGPHSTRGKRSSPHSPIEEESATLRKRREFGPLNAVLGHARQDQVQKTHRGCPKLGECGQSTHVLSGLL